MFPFRNPLDDAINKAQGNALKVQTPTGKPSNVLFTLPTKSVKKVTKGLEQAQGVSFAPTAVSKAPVYTPKQPEYFVPGNKSIIQDKFLVNNRGGSTVSKAYLDYASPTLTSVDDHIRDLDKNKKILQALKAEGKLSEEDKNILVTDREKGITQAESLGKLMEKKRYQLGTLKTGKELTPARVGFGKDVDPLVNENNIASLMDKSEMDAYITSKRNPVLNDYITKSLGEGKSKEQVKADVTMKFLQKDIEDELYANKNLFEKGLRNAGVTLDSTVTEIAAAIPRLLAFAVNSTTWDGIEQNKAGRAINNWTDKITNKHYKSLGADTGEVSGDMDNALVAGNVLGLILPFFLTGGVGTAAQTEKIGAFASKFPKAAKALEIVYKGLPGLEKGSKPSAKMINYLQRLGGSLTRNAALTTGVMAGDTGIGPTGTELAIGTLGGTILEGGLGTANKILDATGAKVALAGVFKFGARKRLVRELADEGEVGTVTNVWKWLKDRGLNRGNEEEMVEALTKHTEDSYGAVNAITKKMDEAGVRIPDDGYLSGSLKKVRDKLKGSESPEQVAKAKRVDELLAKVEKEGSLAPTEANEVKRLLDENLDMFTMEGFIKKPQKDNVALRSGVRKSIEDAGEKLGFDVRAINAETAVSRKMRDGMLDKMLSDNIVERATMFTVKNLIRGGIGVSAGPFDNSTPEGKLGNFLLGVGAGYAAKPFVENQRFKNFIGRMLTIFTKKEKGALEQFMQKGKTTPEAEAAIKKFVETMRQQEKAVYDDMQKNMKLLPPPSGKAVSPSVIDANPQTGYSPGNMEKNNKALYGTTSLPTKQVPVTNPTQTASTVEANPVISQITKVPKKTSLGSEGTQQGKATVKEVSIPSKKEVNTPILQKIAKKQETPKTMPKKTFTNPIDGKVQDPMKIPSDWASYTSKQKADYMEGLNSFNGTTTKKIDLPKEGGKSADDFKILFKGKIKDLQPSDYRRFSQSIEADFGKTVVQKMIDKLGMDKISEMTQRDILNYLKDTKKPSLPLSNRTPVVYSKVDLASEARKYKTADDFVKAQTRALYEILPPNYELRDYQIVGSTATNKASPNDLDVVLDIYNKKTGKRVKDLFDIDDGTNLARNALDLLDKIEKVLTKKIGNGKKVDVFLKELDKNKPHRTLLEIYNISKK